MVSLPASDPSLADITSLVAQINNAYNSLANGHKDPKTQAATRNSLVSAARQLATAAQAPHEAAMSIALGNAMYPCILSASRCGLLKVWPVAEMTAEELGEMTGADTILIVRIMRALVVNGIFSEVGEDRYAHNFLSKALCDPGLQTTLGWMTPGLNALPSYLSTTSFCNPGSDPATASLFQYANQTPLSFYQALAGNPAVRAGFDIQMAKHIASERSRYASGFASLWDFEGRISPLIRGEDDVAIVDVGGSKGHVLQDVKRFCPGLKGRMVLEEVPSIVGAMEPLSGIEIIAYDFLTGEQPVKGAAVYLFRQIFLNWSDGLAKQILKNTIPALDPSRSRILIMEQVLPPTGAAFQPVMLDLQMMQMGGGVRTEKQWRVLLEGCGLSICGIWPTGSGQSVIEVMRAGEERETSKP